MTELTFKYKSESVRATRPAPPQKPGKWAKRIAIYTLIAAILTFLTWVIRAWMVVHR